MKTPNRVWIINEWIPFKLTEFNEEGLSGTCSISGIAINKELDNQNIIATIIHEAMHKVMNKSGLSNVLDDNVSESVCENAELLFISLLTDEDMMAWIAEKWAKR